MNQEPAADLGASAARLLAEAAAVQSDLDAFVTRSRAGLAESFGPAAVTTAYDADGILAELRIDQEARRQLTEDQLLAQLDAALGSSPAVAVGADPQSVVARLRGVLAAAEAGGAAELPRDELTTPDGALTLLAVDGRPTGVRTRPGWILSEPSAELGAAIVRLARQAAVTAQDAREAR